VSDHFRDLEQLGKAGRKDIVLLATVSSFGDIDMPSATDCKQFCGLFVPLFAEASRNAQRTAAAALSQSPHTPRIVAETIAAQAIDVAAPFLARCEALGDDFLIATMHRMGPAHARAIARRARLSQHLVAALMALDDPSVTRTLQLRNLLPEAEPTDDPLAAVVDEAAAGDDDTLRQTLRQLVRAAPANAGHDGSIGASTRPVQPAAGDASHMTRAHDRLTAFALAGEPAYFTTALADALGSSFALAERIMLDISGRQLAQTLLALGMRYTGIVVALEQFFPHLTQTAHGERLSVHLLRSCSLVEAIDRIETWRRADTKQAERQRARPSPAKRPSLAESARRSAND
jgi:uncharacterized protein (DUF2336 family)